ncbi:ADP-ribosyltransferase [Brucella intermedia]|uniref:ADP-ribosyltransferase n=1 Tax=Brucella TaxID=234 RepID=UPI0009465AF3|nr:ADP-ribosyltransferase [Brucella intermedia]
MRKFTEHFEREAGALRALTAGAAALSSLASPDVHQGNFDEHAITLEPRPWMEKHPADDDFDNLPIEEKRKKALEEISHGVRDTTQKARIEAAEAHWSSYMLQLSDPQTNELIVQAIHRSGTDGLLLRNGTKGLNECEMKSFLYDVSNNDQSVTGNPSDAAYIVCRSEKLNLTPEQFKQLRGRTLADKAFMMTTLNDGLSGKLPFRHNAILHLRIPEGAPAIYLNDALVGVQGAQQLLVGRDAVINVTRSFCSSDAHGDDGCKQWEIYGEVVLRPVELEVEAYGNDAIVARVTFHRASETNWIGVVPKGKLPTESNIVRQIDVRTANERIEFRSLPAGEYTVHVFPDKISYAPLKSADIMVGSWVVRSVRQTEIPEIEPGGFGKAKIELESTGTGKDGGSYVMKAPPGFTFADNDVVTRHPDGSDAGHGWTLSSDGRVLTNNGAWWDAKGIWTIVVNLRADKDANAVGIRKAESGLSFAVNGQPPATGTLAAGVRAVNWAKQTTVPEIKPGDTGTVMIQLESTGLAQPGGTYALNTLTAPAGFTFSDDVKTWKPDGTMYAKVWRLSEDRKKLVNYFGAMWHEKGVWTVEARLTAELDVTSGTHAAKDGLSFTTGGGMHRLTGDLSAIIAAVATPVISRAWASSKKADGNWLTAVEGIGVPEAQLQFKTRSGTWKTALTVGSDGKFSFVTDDHENDRISVRQVIKGETSAEAVKGPIGTGASLSAESTALMTVVGHVEFSRADSRNWIGAFREGDRPSDTEPVWSTQITTATRDFEARLNPGSFTIHAFADGSLTPLQSVNITILDI